MRRLSALVTAGVVMASLFATAGTASAAPGDATLWVVHGVPGATVEVCVNGESAKEDFAYRQKFSTALTPGDYTFTLYPTAANCMGTPIDTADITRTLATDGNYTLVAGVSNQTGKVRFFWFANDVANTKRGMFRLSIRHIAVAPAESRTAVQLYLMGNPTVGYKYLRIDQDVVKAA